MTAVRYAAVSMVERGILLLVVWNERYKGWAMPGGMGEDGETPEETQARELREETGMRTRCAARVYEGDAVAEGVPVVAGRASRLVLFRVEAEGDPIAMEGGPAPRWMTRKEFLHESVFAPVYRTVFAVLDADAVLERFFPILEDLALDDIAALQRAEYVRPMYVWTPRGLERGETIEAERRKGGRR